MKILRTQNEYLEKMVEYQKAKIEKMTQEVKVANLVKIKSFKKAEDADNQVKSLRM